MTRYRSPSTGKMTSHPALEFSRVRALVWEKEAEDDEFFYFIDGLARVYAKKHYKSDGRVDHDKLLKDYESWKQDKIKETGDDIW